LFSYHFAKVRISEKNTKQKTKILFLLSNGSTIDEIKGTITDKKKQTKVVFLFFFLLN